MSVHGRAGVIPAATASLMRSMQDTTARFIASSVLEESLHIMLCCVVMLSYCMLRQVLVLLLCYTIMITHTYTNTIYYLPPSVPVPLPHYLSNTHTHTHTLPPIYSSYITLTHTHTVTHTLTHTLTTPAYLLGIQRSR